MGMTKAQKAEYNRVKSEGADKVTLKALGNTFKQERIAENTQLQQLKDAQKAELYSLEKNLRDSGLSKKEIKNTLSAESKANKLEYSDRANTLRGEVGTGFIGYQNEQGQRGPILSSAISYANNPDLLKAVGSDFSNALQTYSDFGVPMYAKQGKVATGVGMRGLMQAIDNKDEATGRFQDKGAGAFLNKLGDYKEKPLTAEEIMGKPGKGLKQDKTNPDLFYRKAGGNYYYFNKNADGTYSNIGGNRVKVDEEKGLFGHGGFLGLGDVLGPMAQIAGAVYGGPWVAAGLNAANTATYGGDLLDTLKSGALSYAGAKFIPDIVSKGLGSDAAVSAFGSNLAKIPGVVPGISQTGMGLLTGQDLATALKSGVIGGAAANVASNVGQATGSKAYGNIAGGVTGGALSGMKPEDIAKATAMDVAGGYATDVAQNYYDQNIKPTVFGGVKSAAETVGAGPKVQSYFDDPKLMTFLKESGKSLIKQQLSGGSQRPNMPFSFAPGSVLRKVSAADQPTTVASTGEPLVVKKGGRIKVDVSKLIPINNGALAKYSR